MITFMQGTREVKILTDKIVALEIGDNGPDDEPWRLEIKLLGNYEYVFRFKTIEETLKKVREIESKLERR